MNQQALIGASLNELAREVHAANAHWWQDPATGERLVRNKGELLMLIVSELAEAMEGARKDLMDTHLPHRSMEEVELADTLIRALDFAGGFGYDLLAGYQGAIELGPLPRTGNKGEMLLHLVSRVTQIGLVVECGFGHYAVSDRLAWFIDGIYEYAAHFDFEIEGAMDEKRAYNAVRADHQPAARLAEGGKKW